MGKANKDESLNKFGYSSKTACGTQPVESSEDLPETVSSKARGQSWA